MDCTFWRENLHVVLPCVFDCPNHNCMADTAGYLDIAIAVLIPCDDCSTVHTMPRKWLPFKFIRLRHRSISPISCCLQIAALISLVNRSSGKLGSVICLWKSKDCVIAPQFSHSIHPSVSSRQRFLLIAPHFGHSISYSIMKVNQPPLNEIFQHFYGNALNDAILHINVIQTAVFWM